MAQYISKDALVAEITHKIKVLEAFIKNFDGISDKVEKAKNKIDALGDVLLFINTLKVKEVELEKEMIEECPFRKVGCEMYEGHILECKGACGWIVDHLKLKELKAQKGEK